MWSPTAIWTPAWPTRALAWGFPSPGFSRWRKGPQGGLDPTSPSSWTSPRRRPTPKADPLQRNPIDDIAGATWCPTDGVLDPHGIAMAFLAEAKRLGAAVRLNAPAQAIANAGSPAAAPSPF